MQHQLNKPTAFILSIGAVAVRLLPHPANLTPLGATALFGGAKLSRPWNYIAPLLILFVTDLFIGFHALMPYVYLCFIATVFISEITLKDSISARKLVVLSVVNSLIFFFVTNFAVWVEGRLYPLTSTGLIQSYVMGLPFLRNMMLGDIGYTLGVFGLYALATRYQATRQFDSRVSSWFIKSVS